MLWRASIVCLFFTAACSDNSVGTTPDADADVAGDADADAAGGDSSDGDGDGDDAGPTDDDPPVAGTIPLTLTADGGAGVDVVVSLGVPFAPGVLTDLTLVRVRNASGAEVAAHVASLALWPSGGQRSVLVGFRASLAANATASWWIDYGTPRAMTSAALTPNPDGPVAATLPADWYAESRVIGFQVSASRNTAFADWETGIEGYLTSMNPAWETYGLSCANTSAERAYYDGPHALYQRFIHHGDTAKYRRARAEAVWYRANELNWFASGEVAVYACVTSWDPSTPLAWGALRRMLGQGMLDDYLLTGDPDARRAVLGLGEAFRRNLPALTSGSEITVKVTERNMAWPMMGLASAYAVDQRTDLLTALEQLVTMATQWQAATTSGAFEHDIQRPDPEECYGGPSGASPFMTSLLIDGLMDAYFLTGDAGIGDVVVKAAEWYRDDATTTDGRTFMYLWGCDDGPTDYAIGEAADLNLLISHVFGAAYYFTNDAAWLDFGDTMAGNGVEDLYGGRPKQWSQAVRTFIKYMGYRAMGRTP